MVRQYYHWRLLVTTIAVALSVSFYYEPSFPRHVKESGHEIEIFERMMRKEVDLNDKRTSELYKKVFVKNKDQDTTYLGAQALGVLIAWRAVDVYGARSALLRANGMRLIGLMLHVGEITYRTCNPHSVSPEFNTFTVEVKFIRCGCGHHDFGEDENMKQIENATATTTTPTATTATTATPTPLPLLASEPEEEETTQTSGRPRRVSDLDISLWSKCAHGAYSGMSTFMGILYLYDITPKGTKIYSVGVLAYYFMLTTTVKYFVEMGLRPPVIYSSKADFPAWSASGILTLAAMVVQVILLSKYCQDSPSFLLHQKKNKEAAKKALIELRPTNQVEHELEIIEKKKGQRDPIIRASLLMFTYITYLMYNYTYMFLGILNAVAIGIPLIICVNIYYIVNILSFSMSLIFFKNLYLITIRNVLIYYYVCLGTLYFINASLVSSNVHYGTELFQNRQTVSAFVVALTLLMHIFFSSGMAIFTIVLVNEYSSPKARLWNIMIGGTVATTFSIGGALFFLKGILIFYYFQPMSWLYLGLLIWVVGKWEMSKFGLAPNGIWAMDCFVVDDDDEAPMKDPKPEKENMPRPESKA